jgi:hypothetical protein
VSQRDFWIRCKCGGETDALSRLCQVGNKVRVTQVRQIHSTSATPIFETNESQSQMKKIQDRSSTVGTFKRYFQWRDDLVYPVGEVSLICRVVDWRVVSPGSSADGFTGFEIHAIDSSRCTLLFQFSLPSCLFQSKSLYPWLQRGGCLRLRYAAVREYDKKHDILIVLRTEHTIVETLTEQMALESTEDRDPGPLLSQLDSLPLETEQRRMASLRDGKEYFFLERREGQSKAVVMESCERRRSGGVRGSVTPCGDGLVASFRHLQHKVDDRIASWFRSSPAPRAPSLHGDVLVANRRYLRESFELEREELVVLEYFPVAERQQ